MQIMQCFHTNIDRAKLVDSQSVFVFSLGGLDSSQFLLLEIDKISDVKHQLFWSAPSNLGSNIYNEKFALFLPPEILNI